MTQRRFINASLLTIFLLSILIASCSVEKNTAATRNFHNLTSHYNIYFNALESYKKGLQRAEETFQDDFTSLLPLFYYEDESLQQSLTPQMKRAIDKSTKVATFHSITAKPKVRRGRQSEKDKAFYERNEYNKWMDDSYLLIGKSYMHQGEFFLASETFKHVIRTFPDEEAYYLGLTWLARTYLVIGEYDDAEEILVNLKDLDEYPKKYLETLYTTLADYYIRLEDYNEAASYLELALETKPTKSKRIRYTYILAQLYKEAENGEASIRNFQKVVNMNPPYVMAFNAKVSMAEAFQAGDSNSEDIKKLLNKMLKDSKNKEFLDQIYFALGNIAQEEGERKQAIEYYHLSVRSSVQNNFQKGESCLTLANIYYEQPKYTLSAAYYDTAVNMLDPDYPNYNTLMIRSMSLNRLVYNINTFELQDSLQILAAMPEDERLLAIDQLIEQVRKEEEEARQREQNAMQDLQFARSGFYSSNDNMGGTGQTGGKWYFYNLNAKSFGQPEFRMKWGDRKLEDNWRRRNKQSVTALLEEGGMSVEGANGEVAAEILDNKSREYYLKDIPMNDSAIDISHTRLEEALYNMGMIYKDDLLDYKKAIESLEELVGRYSDGSYTMAAYYYLYELYNSVQQPARADQYKNLLSRKYPDSHMAKLLTNPNYINELEAEASKSERFYEGVYDQFNAGNYSYVIRQADSGAETYGDDKDLLMRLQYLRALSVGAVQGKEAMKTELDSIVAHYPGTEIGEEAREIIAYMYVAFPVIKEADQEREAVALYAYEPEAPHYFLIALRNSFDLNQVNFNLLNYNLDNFMTYDLKIELKQLRDGYNVLMVREFGDIEGVRRYTDRVKTDIVQVMGEIPPEDYYVLIISTLNYDKLIDAGDFIPYLLFHKKNYLE